jgi:subtilase family serine protease
MKRILFLSMVSILFAFEAKSQDLVIDSIDFPEQILTNHYAYLTVYCSNIGTEAAENFYIRIYLSEDNKQDYLDYNLTEIYRNNLQGGEQYKSWNIYINTKDFITGDYYLIITADYKDDVNQTNNTFIEPFSINDPSTMIGPDLKIANLELDSDTAEMNKNFEGQISITNIGTGPAVNFYTYVYLSKDTLKGSDVYIWNRYQNDTIFPGDTVEMNFTGNINIENTISGMYYALGSVDHQNYIAESNENNNIETIPLFLNISTDLYAKNLNLGSGRAQGALLKYTFDLHTSTDKNVGTIFYKTYLSKDTALGANDIELIGNNIYVGSDSVTHVKNQVNIPNVAPGNYHLIIALDKDNSIKENNELNNLIVSPSFDITPTITDLLIDSVRLSATELNVNTYYNLSLALKKEGADSLGYVNYSMFLSTDSLLDPTDISLSYGNFTFSGNSTYYQPFSTLYIPSNLQPGPYYVIVAIDRNPDGLGFIAETNEYNNLAHIPVNIVNTPLPAYDLYNHSFNLYERSMFYTDIQYGIIIGVGNTTANPTPASTGQHLYLSSDSVLDGADILIYESNFSSGITNSTNLYPYFIIPGHIDTGTYYFIHMVNAYGKFHETDYSNNLLVSGPITVLNNNYDLQPLGIEIENDTLLTDRNHRIQLSFTNNSDAALSGLYFDNALYLSTDDKYDRFDKYITAHRVSSVGAMDTVQQSINLSLAGTQPGDYYLIYRTDYGNAIKEYDENNNTISHPVLIAHPDADLEVASVDMPGEIPAGNSRTITIALRNNGKETLNNALVTYYLSAHPEYNPVWSKYLGQRTISTLLPGETVETTPDITFAKEIPIGNYYVHFIADKNNNIAETNEDNNTLVKSLAIVENTIELSVYNYSLNKTVYTHSDNINVNVKLINNGNSHYSNPQIAVYLSKNAVFDKFDKRLANQNCYFNNGDPVSNNRSFNVSIPKELATGEYYLFLVADPDNLIEEIDETNNYKYIKFELTAKDIDIEMARVTMENNTIEPGIYKNLRYYFINTGKDISTNFRIHVYISEDEHLDKDNDYLISNYYFNNIAPDDTLNRSIGFTLNNIPSGEFYIIVAADANDDIYETNEENNILIQPVTVLPSVVDIQIDNLTVNSATIKNGTSFNVSYNLLNNGTNASGYFYVNFYFSEDGLLDFTDTEVYSQYVSNLQGMDTLSFTIYPLSSVPKSGTYYLIAKADANGNVTETDETNNTAMVQVNVVNSDIDLVSTSFSIDKDSIEQYGYLYIRNTVGNTGSEPCGPSRSSYYISADTVLDYFDKEIDYIDITALNPGSNYSFNRNLYMGNYAPGNYFLINKIDKEDKIAETNEDNNIQYLPFTIKGTAQKFVDLYFKRPPVMVDTFKMGESVNFKAAIQSNAPVSRHTYLGLYLSEDSIIDNKDQLISHFYVSQFNDSVLVNSSFRISQANIQSGSYYIIFAIDRYAYITESNKANNVFAKKIVVNDVDVDLITSNFSTGHAEITAGNYLPFSATTSNLGTAANIGFYNSLYFSKDSVFDIFDRRLHDYYVSMNNGHTSSTYNSNLYIPNVEGGEYYLLKQVDIYSNVYELNENNNMFILPITVNDNSRDVSIEHFISSSRQSRPGDSVDFSFDITANNNTKISDGFRSRLYLSEDEELSFFDQMVADIYLDSLVPGSPYHFNLKFGMPMNLKTYYFIALADEDNDIPEADEFNNMKVINVKTKYPVLEAETIEPGQSARIYPNPVHSSFNMIMEGLLEGHVDISIMDINGKTWADKKYPVSHGLIENIDASQLPMGLYYIQIKTRTLIYTQKFIKQRP